MTQPQEIHTPTTAVVLSGGGARGAYEVGVVAGIVEVLRRDMDEVSPFQVFAGTSVGAINATFLASRCHDGDLDVEELVRLWQSLELRRHLRVNALSLLSWPRNLPWLRLRRRTDAHTIGPRLGRSILDPRPLEELVSQSIAWPELHRNIRHGTVQALIIAALHIGSGRTTVFAELADGAPFRPSKDPRRIASLKPITADHVLASAAIPMLFPARRIGHTYYCDGGLRFNTPMSPAIRAGAERLVVVSLMHNHFTVPTWLSRFDNVAIEQYPNPIFLAGKLLNALLLDPIMYDLQTLDRINALMTAIERATSPEHLDAVRQLLVTTRGVAYRNIQTLVFAPSQDIGALAGEHLAEHLHRWHVPPVIRWLLGQAATHDATWEADLASYLLFDGAFATRLIELGRADVLRRSRDVLAFFNAPP